MRTRDIEVDERILDISRKEFLEKGYNQVSLRDIAKKAGVTTGSIYARYKNKNELFHCICDHTIHAMKKIFDDCTNSINKYDERVLCDASVMKEIFYLHENIISQNIEELQLLLYKSGGSNLENYRNNLIDDYMNNAMSKIKINKRYGLTVDETSYINMLIRSLASYYVAYIEELILRKERNIPDQEYYAYIDNMSLIIFGVFKQIFNYSKEV